MNSDETWLLYLWSGTFASAIGGAVAALVAMVVLRKTNEHQTTLADKQLDEQRRQAELGRRNAALADLIDALALMGTKSSSGLQEISDLAMRARTATVRWRLDNGDEAVAQALEQIVGNVASAAMKLSGSGFFKQRPWLAGQRRLRCWPRDWTTSTAGQE